MTRPLTHKQATWLALLSPGAAIIAPDPRLWQPLQKRGLVEPFSLPGRLVPPDGMLRITAAGLRALADHIDQHGQPPWTDTA